MNGVVDSQDDQHSVVHQNVYEINVKLFSSSTKARISQLNTLGDEIAAGGMFRGRSMHS